MTQKVSTVASGEVEFAFDELFFSRTDDRGIILSGNEVFQRISMYAWDELLKKPHNIIRHPDMPKAVFWLLWHTIKANQPIGAYVKNRAKDGRYYWVFAIVTPIEGGYLSVRLKPSSDVFKVVQQEYKNLLATEIGNAMKPADSGAALLGRLAELGFRDYKAFMAAALSLEIKSRDKELGHKPNQRIHIFDELVAAASQLSKQADIVFNAYSLNQYVPLNLQVQAAQLGDSGRTIAVISSNYNVISNEIRTSMQNFTQAALQVAETINEGLFLVCVAEIQKEVWQLFVEETKKGDADHKEEMQMLESQQNEYERKAMQGLNSIAQQVQTFRESCLDMKRLLAALEVTRVMGKVENSKLAVSKAELDELVLDLEQFQTVVAGSLKEIEGVNREVQGNIEKLLYVSDRKQASGA